MNPTGPLKHHRYVRTHGAPKRLTGISPGPLPRGATQNAYKPQNAHARIGRTGRKTECHTARKARRTQQGPSQATQGEERGTPKLESEPKPRKDPPRVRGGPATGRATGGKGAPKPKEPGPPPHTESPKAQRIHARKAFLLSILQPTGPKSDTQPLVSPCGPVLWGVLSHHFPTISPTSR